MLWGTSSFNMLFLPYWIIIVNSCSAPTIFDDLDRQSQAGSTTRMLCSAASYINSARLTSQSVLVSGIGRSHIAIGRNITTERPRGSTLASLARRCPPAYKVLKLMGRKTRTLRERSVADRIGEVTIESSRCVSRPRFDHRKHEAIWLSLWFCRSTLSHLSNAPVMKSKAPMSIRVD